MPGFFMLRIMPMTSPCKNLGFGLGLRPDHYIDILETQPDVDWFELLTENYLVPGGKPLYYLDEICERYPVVMHGVSLSLGSTDPLDYDYLNQVKQLAERSNAHWISDHLCWTGIEQKNMHDLLPLPYTEEAIDHVADRIKAVQDYLQQPILIENVSSYVTYIDSAMTEWTFINEILDRADCYMLFDVNNIYVSGFNHNFDPVDFINGINAKRIGQIHLAGHSNYGDYIIDTHDQTIIDPVWQLYECSLQRFGAVSTMIERDDNIPPLSELITELQMARGIASNTLAVQTL